MISRQRIVLARRSCSSASNSQLRTLTGGLLRRGVGGLASSRSTYLATTSTSRLTGSPTCLRPSVVSSSVVGIRLTVNDSSSSDGDGQRDAVDGDRALVHDVAGQLGRAARRGRPPSAPTARARAIVPVPSTWPCTRCPPSRPSSRIGRSRLTGTPAASAPRQLRSRVSRITSAVNAVVGRVDDGQAARR